MAFYDVWSLEDTMRDTVWWYGVLGVEGDNWYAWLRFLDSEQNCQQKQIWHLLWCVPVMVPQRVVSPPCLKHPQHTQPPLRALFSHKHLSIVGMPNEQWSVAEWQLGKEEPQERGERQPHVWSKCKVYHMYTSIETRRWRCYTKRHQLYMSDVNSEIRKSTVCMRAFGLQM